MRVRRRHFIIAAGALGASSLVLGQQATRKIRVGVLSQRFEPEAAFWHPMFAALRERGWHHGVNFSLVVKEAYGDIALARRLATELVDQGVDLVLAFTSALALVAKQTSSTVPVVTWCGYPVESGLAASLARPGANVTGVANYANAEIWSKFVELLRELKPSLRELGVLWDYAPPAFPDGLVPIPAIRKGAERVGIRASTWMVHNDGELARALAAVESGPVEALIVTQGGGIHNDSAAMDRIGAVLARQRLPAIVDIAAGLFSRTPGCVLAYSPNVLEILRRLADLTDRVLRGAKPADLPFELPSKFDLAINAKTARALGLTVPQGLLLRADRVIE